METSPIYMERDLVSMAVVILESPQWLHEHIFSRGCWETLGPGYYLVSGRASIAQDGLFKLAHDSEYDFK